MRHDAQVAAMRRSGIKPAHVTLVDAYPSAAWWQWPETRSYAEVHVDSIESPELADLRFVLGIPVMVDVIDPARCMRWAMACKAAGGAPVFALHPTAEVV